MTSEPWWNEGARVCFASWSYQTRLLLSPPADTHKSVNEAPGAARRTTPLRGERGNGTVRPPPTRTAWSLSAELLCLHRSKRKMTTTRLPYFLVFALFFKVLTSCSYPVNVLFMALSFHSFLSQFIFFSYLALYCLHIFPSATFSIFYKFSFPHLRVNLFLLMKSNVFARLQFKLCFCFLKEHEHKHL